MSRRFKVDADDYAEFRPPSRRWSRRASSSSARTRRCSKPDHAGAIIGLFRRSSKGFGFVRPHTSTAKADQIYIPPEAGRRRLQRRRGRRQDHQAAQEAGDEPRGADRPGRGPGLGAVRRDLLRGRRRRVTSRSTAPRSTTRSTSATPAPRGPSRATRSPSRWSATRPRTRKARG